MFSARPGFAERWDRGTLSRRQMGQWQAFHALPGSEIYIFKGFMDRKL